MSDPVGQEDEPGCRHRLPCLSSLTTVELTQMPVGEQCLLAFSDENPNEISHDSVSKVRMANRRLAALQDGIWKRHHMNFLTIPGGRRRR
jgi:hypothetical protein